MKEDLDQWREDVDRSILATLASVAAAIVPVGSASTDLTYAIGRASEGGKRVRAMLLIASHDALGGDHHRAAVTFASALELFHTAALLHDDVLDDSDTRRGRPAAHRTLAATHRASEWLGEPDAFGTAGAILAGDLALMASHRALAAGTALLPEPRRQPASALFLETAELVTAGQYLDIRMAAQPFDDIQRQEADIRATMRSKTASYTCEAPLALGAAAAGASEAVVAQLRAVGLHAGIAFQLRDDILGLRGDVAATGKPAGDDLREGKRTLPLWLAWMHATEAQRAKLGKVVGQRRASASAVAAAIGIIESTGAFDAVEREIAQSSAAAHAALDAVPYTPRGRRIVEHLIAGIGERDR